MNITVRVDGIINNTQTEAEFVGIVSQIFGDGKSLEEYIELYNAHPRTQKASIAVHKEVPSDMDEIAAKVEAEMLPDPADASAQDYLDAATQTLSDVVGRPVTIEFASDDE
jgi:hypothetical protein